MHKVQMYTTAICPYCVRAKRLLELKGVEYEEIRIDGDREQMRVMMERSKRHTVPQIFIGETHVGGYDDWLQQRQASATEPIKTKAMSRGKPKQERPRKLTLKEKRELDELPLQIETLESEIAVLHEKVADPEFYRTAGAAVADVNARLEEIERELATIYDRWQELDALGD